MSNNSLSLKSLAALVQGVYLGEEDIAITGVAKLEEAKAGDLCFFANPKYENQLYLTNATCVIVPIGFKPNQVVSFQTIEHANPYYAFCLILNQHFNPNPHSQGIDEQSFIHPTAKTEGISYLGKFSYIDENAVLAPNVVIYPQVYIGKGVEIGANTIVYPGVKIYAGCKIGKNCILHAGTVIGSDGFGFAPIGDMYLKIPQIGNVLIEDDVEIGSNCSIDRATMGNTVIKKGTKLDNLIQIAHNVEIGQNTVIAAQAGVSGSVKIGDNCQIGGQTGFVGHISIANKVGIGAQAGVSKSIEEEGTQWIGSPALPLKDFFKAQAVFKNLVELQRRVNALEHQLKNINNPS